MCENGDETKCCKSPRSTDQLRNPRLTMIDVVLKDESLLQNTSSGNPSPNGEATRINGGWILTRKELLDINSFFDTLKRL